VAQADRPVNVAGTVLPPGDKSITHRVLMLASLLHGTSTVHGALTSADARSTARCLRILGAGVSPMRSGCVRIRGARWRAPAATLHCGNSGTTARLLLGLLAAHPFETRLSGDGSLRRRPMRRVTEPLVRMGATVVEERGGGLPLRIHGGALQPITWEMPVASAQVKTALLFAGLAAGVRVAVREPVPSRDHTERMLRALGAPLRIEDGRVVLEQAPAWLAGCPALDWQVAGDASSAAFLVAAGLLARRGELRIRDVGVNPTRTGYLSVLSRMGASVTPEAARDVCGEPVGDLVVRPTGLRGTTVCAVEVPSLIDEVPVLAILASRADGETVFESVGELRVKESDRLGLLAANLRAVGVRAEVAGEDLVVEGTDRPPRGRVDTAGDHRLAMAFAVLGRVRGARVVLSEHASPVVSYPGFFATLDRITGHAR
jgi:3-phosphoshikimate 1-carboxyvinyltransferase